MPNTKYHPNSFWLNWDVNSQLWLYGWIFLRIVSEPRLENNITMIMRVGVQVKTIGNMK
jgi:hypothetical protein